MTMSNALCPISKLTTSEQALHNGVEWGWRRSFGNTLGIVFLAIAGMWMGGRSVCHAAPPQVQQVEFVVGAYLTSEGGESKPSDSPLQRPFGTDFDSRGRMYIVELEGGRVHRLNEEGTPEVISGDGSKSYRGDGRPIAEATYNGMHNIAISEGDLAYISDSFNHVVRVIDLNTGTISTLSGNGQPGFAGDGGPAQQAVYDYLMCVSLNADGTELYMADLKNLRVRKIDLARGIVSTVAGNGMKGVPTDGIRATASPLVDPRAVAIDSPGNLYVLERNGHALRRVDPQGNISTVAGTGAKGFKDGPALTAQFDSPKHICVDRFDRVYIADDANGAIRCYDPQSATVTTLLGRGFGDPRIKLNQPHGVTIYKDALYVCDTSNHRIFKLTLDHGEE